MVISNFTANNTASDWRHHIVYIHNGNLTELLEDSSNCGEIILSGTTLSLRGTNGYSGYSYYTEFTIMQLN